MANYFDKTIKKCLESTDLYPASFSPDHLPGNYKIGDIIHVTVELKQINHIIPKHPDGKSKQGTTKDFLKDFFQNFFIFKSDSDPNELNMTLVDVQKIATTKSYELKYLFNLSDLNSGDKEINMYAHSDGTPDAGDKLSGSKNTSSKKEIIEIIDLESLIEGGSLTEEKLNDAPLTFYLNQSIMDRFQDNITNGGIDVSSGLDRDKVNFPSYLPVGLQPINPFVTKDVALWEVIRDGTNALSFNSYTGFMDYLFCGGINPFGNNSTIEGEYKKKLVTIDSNLKLPFNNVDAYRALKVATEVFVMATVTVSSNNAHLTNAYNDYLKEFNTRVADPATIKILPYLALIRQKLPDLDFKFFSFDEAISSYLDPSLGRLTESCYGLIAAKLQYPCFLELIWNYWHEESMMVQGISTIARRFQNIRGNGVIDPLANLEIGPLRPLNNLMWGYIQDEQHRLTVRRRAYEYDHHYGITLQGTAVRGMKMADSRSKFIEAFHTLLNLCMKFYHQYDDTTVVADGFPIMNALKEVHMILSEGAHNQFGDLPSTARIEMLMQLYILARPEFREFLPTRQMVAYPEAWMDRVGVLNQMHNWTKTNVLHYRDLGMFGEQIILSIRFGAWSDVINRDQAANWAIFWRPQIQNYMHAYRAVSGVDLTREDGVIDVQQPSIHLLRRLNEEKSKIRI